MAIDLQALRDEITNNPVSMPYPAFVDTNDVAIADILNNSDGTNSRTVNRDEIQTADFVGATTYAAYDTLTASEESFYGMQTNRDTMRVTPDTLQSWCGIGGASLWATAQRSTMEPRIAALMQYAGSRAEEISDVLGVSSVTPTNVRDARLLT